VRALALALLMVGSAVAAQGQHAAHDSTFGSHGMVLFGERGQFLSHLPLYRAPHDWQMLLRVYLEADSATSVADPVAVLQADRSATGEVLYTIEPEEFAHSRLATDNAFTFRATVFRGHFERGGAPIMRGVIVLVERVLHRRRLHRAAPDSKPGRFLLLRDEGEAYLVHHIGGAPDFDQILSVRLHGEALITETADLHALGDETLGPVVAGPIHLMGPGVFHLRADVVRQIYLEHGDLEATP
jgi:hypothetical protein